MGVGLMDPATETTVPGWPPAALAAGAAEYCVFWPALVVIKDRSGYSILKKGREHVLMS